jgi:hypothetical protein
MWALQGIRKGRISQNASRLIQVMFILSKYMYELPPLLKPNAPIRKHTPRV